jgi:CheY-like chemotaxis protein
MLTHGPTDVLVALIGFPQPLPKNAIGIFRRCGLSLIASDDLEHVARIMRTLALDAVVVDSHSPRLGDIHSALEALLQIRQQGCRNGRVPPLVVLTSENCTPSVRHLLTASATIPLPTSRQTYRELARLLRHLAGLEQPCCGSSAPTAL